MVSPQAEDVYLLVPQQMAYRHLRPVLPVYRVYEK